MAVPKVLRQQQAEARAKAGLPPVVEAEVSPESVVIETPEARVEPVVETPEPVIETPAPVIPEPAPRQVPQEESAAYWKSRFEVTDGMLKKTGEDNRALQEKVGVLTDSMTGLQTSLDLLLTNQRVPEAPAAPAAPAAEALSEEDRNLLGGEEPVNAIRIIAKQEVAVAIESLRAEFQGLVTPMKTQVEEITLTTAEQKRVAKFNADLAALVPQCQEVHFDPAFKEWIAGKEDIYGNPYLDLYNEAITNTLDAKIAAGIQKAFLNDQPALPAPAPAPVVAPPAPAPRSVIPAGMEDQIAPSRSLGGADGSGAPVAFRMVTQEEMDAAYLNRQSNKITQAQLDDIRVRYLKTIALTRSKK